MFDQCAKKCRLNMIRQSKIGHRRMNDRRKFFVMNMTNTSKQVVFYLKIQTACEPREQAKESLIELIFQIELEENTVLLVYQ